MGTRRTWIGAGAGLVIVIAVASAFAPRAREPQAAAPAPARPAGVACLGRIEPMDGVIRVGAPYFESRPALIRSVRVHEGDWVKAGQPLAVLDGKAKLEAAAAQADADVMVARRRLELVKSGAKPDDLAAQREEIARWEVVLENARNELQRYQRLYAKDDVTGADLDQKRVAAETAAHSLDEAKAKLRSMSNVRENDVAMAESEVRSAEAAAQRARASLESATVRAPQDGQVLKIRAHAGEEAGADGVLELGRTDQMYVVAEVYETDIARVHLGDAASITSDLFPGTLNGKVDRIEEQISKGEVLPSDPVAYADARVVHVKVKLADSKPVANLINGKVSVQIHP